jgi:hypothetical protein
MRVSIVCTFSHVLLCAAGLIQAKEIVAGDSLGEATKRNTGNARGAIATQQLLTTPDHAPAPHGYAVKLVEDEVDNVEPAEAEQVTRRLDGKKACRLKMYWKNGYYWQEGKRAYFKLMMHCTFFKAIYPHSSHCQNTFSTSEQKRVSENGAPRTVTGELK